MNYQTLKALCLLTLLGLIWGSGYAIAKYTMQLGVSPLGYAFWQSIGPASLLIIVSSVTNTNVKITVSRFRFYVITGLLGIAFPNTNMYLVAPHLPSGILALVVNTVMLMTYPIALLSKQEYFSWQRLIGVLIGFLGLLLILLPHAGLPTPEMIPWLLMALLTPLFFAITAVYTACFRPNDTSNIHLSAGMLTVSSIVLYPVVLLTGTYYPFHLHLNLAQELVLLEILLSSMGYILFFRLIAMAGPVYYSLVSCIVAITGLFWGWLVFGEVLNVISAGATSLILLGILLVTFYKK